MSQGRTRKDALLMVADAIEGLMGEGAKVEVFAASGEDFEVGSPDVGRLTALLLRRQREMQGLSLADAAGRLGQKSRNAYARYEQGVSVPTVAKLGELLAVLSPGRDFVLRQAHA